MSFSQAIYDQNKNLLRLTLSSDDKYRLFVPLNEISPILVKTTLFKEDRYFYYHLGVNPWALAKAFWNSVVLRQQRGGASTITMQLARLRYHLDTRSLSGKWQQIIYALRLERHYTKKQILTAYFNLAPYGNNIEGVGAASLIYYHTPVGKLNFPQALVLSIMPQKPVARHGGLSGRQAIGRASTQLFKQWCKAHTCDAATRAMQSLPLALYSLKELPFLAPHFVYRVLEDNPRESNIISTLDLRLQKVIQRIANQYITSKKTLGVNNVAILLLDTRDMEVRALLGSADFFGKEIGGQVNGTAALRSPGSALKPFIYALALDQGLIHPATILKDAPTHFGTYDPENFDHEFVGPIKAQDALIQSRNIPAIYLASKFAKPTFYDFLQKAGLALKAEHYYGLALVLGGAEVTMEKMAELYAMLANQGELQALRFTRNAPYKNGKILLSAEASFLTLDMLQHNQRPDRIALIDATQTDFPIAWKTGTSSGFRDAWTAGVFGPYVLVVWVGNFDGRSNPAFTGHDAAVPLFFSLLNALRQQLGKLPPSHDHPEKLRLARIPVCAASGMLPTPQCPVTQPTWFIIGKSPIKRDTVFREIMLDKKTGLRACHFNPENQFATYEFWPSDLLHIFKQAGIARRVPPPFSPECSLAQQNSGDTAPSITSPRSSFNYVIRRNAKENKGIPLSAVAEADVRELYWFAGNTYLGKAKVDEALLWHPEARGHYAVRVVDELGRTDSVEVVVGEAG